MDLFDLDYDVGGEFMMKYTGNRSEEACVIFTGEYGYMGTINNAEFYVQKKCWKDGCNIPLFGTWDLFTIYKEWEDGIDKNRWIGTVKYFSFIS